MVEIGERISPVDIWQEGVGRTLFVIFPAKLECVVPVKQRGIVLYLGIVDGATLGQVVLDPEGERVVLE